MLKLLIAAALVGAPVQVAPVTNDKPATVDAIARAKFPKDDPLLIDAFASLNKSVNESITYEDDQTHYGVGEMWAMFPPDGKGDCEDYALTKLGVLSLVGFPIVSNAKIVTVSVRDLGGHAILAIHLPSGAVAYLDSNNKEPMTRRELEAQGYQFFDWVA